MNCLGPLCPSSEQFKPDDHSELVPLLPIPNRTVKRLSADDSADSRVKVGHRQATSKREKAPEQSGAFASLVGAGAALAVIADLVKFFIKMLMRCLTR